MKRFSERQSLSTLSELNVTPLLDLAFVLLIIFMITTPLMENSIDLVVPTSVAAENAVDPREVRVVSIDKNGKIALDDEAFSLRDLEIELAALKASNPKTAVVIRSDKTLPVQQVIDVMDALERARITRVGVVTVPEK
jgi:biopolymer transport protein ExbD